MLSLYNRIFKVESPARRLMQHLLSRFICYGKTVPGTLPDRVVSMGDSTTKRAFNSHHIPETTVTNNDDLVDSIRHMKNLGIDHVARNIKEMHVDIALN